MSTRHAFALGAALLLPEAFPGRAEPARVRRGRGSSGVGAGQPRNFGPAPLGRGAVARALDNSSVTPPALVDSLVALARIRGIPLQVGTTNGGNDGSVFAAYGVPDVPGN